MAAILEIIKRYLFEIICGVVAAVGIGLGVWGLNAMSSVKTQMQSAVSVHGQITGLSRGGNPINLEAVEAQRQRIEDIQTSFKRVMEFVRDLDEFQPLLPETFKNWGDTGLRIDFREAYRREVGQWLNILNAGGLPSDDDIARQRDLIEAERPADTTLGSDKNDTINDDAKINKEDTQRPSGLVSDSAAKVSADVRAAIKKAHDIYCYATPESFQDSSVSRLGGPMYSGPPPRPVEIWHAQLEVWIQRDIVDSIARINNQAAEQVEYPWVGNMPVKELISIQTTDDSTGGYYIADKEDKKTGSFSRPGGEDRATPPGSWEEVFTKNKSSDLYELMQFSVKMIVDARDLPMIVSELCRDRFHTPLRISYVAESVDLSMKNKVYGDEPLANVVIDFETVFFSDIYLEYMPPSVREELGKKLPEKDTTK